VSEGGDGYDVKRCGKCAAWIPTSATMCAYCGTSSPDAPPARPRGSILSLRHGFSATKILIAANVAYFLFSLALQYRVTPQGNPAQWATTGTGLNEGLFAAGAYVHESVVREHEWWRVLAAAFLHVGGIHLAVNMWSLLQIGTLAEDLFGTAKFVTVYVVCGITASLAGSFWYAGLHHQPVPPMAGASGALFGIAGLLIAFLFRAGTDQGRRIAWSIGQSVLLMLAIGYFGIMPLSQTGHVGGLLPGLAFGMLVRADFGGRVDPAAQRTWGRAALVLALVCAASLVAASWHGFQLTVGGR